jgi:hypothetical protein
MNYFGKWGIVGTSMISIVKGKTEISLNLPKVLNPFSPLPL